MAKKKYDIVKGAPSVSEFLRQFKNDRDALHFIIKHIFPDGKIVCPYCGCTEQVYEVKYDIGIYSCFHCGKNICVFNGTVFENMMKCTRDWLYIFYQMFVSRKGVSSQQLSRELHRKDETIRRMRRRLQLAMNNYDLEPFQGTIQMDEVYMAGSNHGYFVREHAKDSDRKYPVYGITDGKRVYTCRAIPNEKGQMLTGELLKKFIESTIKPDSIIVTDEFRGYNFLNKKDSNYHHEVVNHAENLYVNENGYTTNQIEGYWGLVKKNYYSTHHWYSKEWSHLYLAEADFRYNHPKWDEALEDLLNQCTLFPQVIDIRKMGRHGNKMYNLNNYKMILPKCYDNKEHITAIDIVICPEPVYGILKTPYESRKKRGYRLNDYPDDWKQVGMVPGGIGYKDYKNNIINTLDDITNMIKDAIKYKNVNTKTVIPKKLDYHQDNEERNKTARKLRIKQRYDRLPTMLKYQIKDEYPNILKVSAKEDTFEIHQRICVLLKWYNKNFKKDSK